MRTERIVENRFFDSGTIRREGFEELLRALLGLYRPLDIRLGHATRRHLPSFRYRSRAGRLERDLRTLGYTWSDLSDFPTASMDSIFPLDGVHSLLGCLYVIEGSELGGRVLWKRFSAALDADTLEANAFFGTRAEQTRARWNRFRDLFNRRVHPGDPLDEASEAARATFRTYRDWLS